jgi:hypothetical protein
MDRVVFGRAMTVWFCVCLAAWQYSPGQDLREYREAVRHRSILARYGSAGEVLEVMGVQNQDKFRTTSCYVVLRTNSGGRVTLPHRESAVRGDFFTYNPEKGELLVRVDEMPPLELPPELPPHPWEAWCRAHRGASLPWLAFLSTFGMGFLVPLLVVIPLGCFLVIPFATLVAVNGLTSSREDEWTIPGKVLVFAVPITAVIALFEGFSILCSLNELLVWVEPAVDKWSPVGLFTGFPLGLWLVNRGLRFLVK